jgi:hypothetical protein
LRLTVLPDGKRFYQIETIHNLEKTVALRDQPETWRVKGEAKKGRLKFFCTRKKRAQLFTEPALFSAL